MSEWASAVASSSTQRVGERDSECSERLCVTRGNIETREGRDDCEERARQRACVSAYECASEEGEGGWAGGHRVGGVNVTQVRCATGRT